MRSRADCTNPSAAGWSVDPRRGDTGLTRRRGANGITEAALTGDTATQVKAAVDKALPGSTIERMETDAEGAKYEAHVTKSDGSDVTVKLDANFKRDRHRQRPRLTRPDQASPEGT